MKRIINVIILFVSVVLFGSCKKFLELEPTTNVKFENSIVDLNSMRTALLGSYSQLKNFNYYGKNVLLLPDLLSDNLFVSVRNSGRGVAHNDYRIISTDAYARDLWTQCYAVSANASFIIQKAEGITVLEAEKAEKNQILGEAHALTGIAYFDLLRFFAQPYSYTANADHPGVPVLKKVNSSISNLDFPSRATVKEGYDWVVSNLTAALAIMPDDIIIKGKSSPTTKTRFSKTAVKGLLARVYLYMGRWEDARKLADEVILSKKYTLLESAKLVEGFKEKNNSENLFEVAFSQTENSGSDMLSYGFNQSGYGDAMATEDLYNLYKDTDQRKKFINKSVRSKAEDPAYIVTKYSNITNYNENHKVIRLAEIYLIRAEALARLNNFADAQKDLDVIRKRGDLTVELSTETGTALIDKILVEKRKELAFEGHRLHDLTRNNLKFIKYVSPLTVGKPTSSVVDFPGRDKLHYRTILPIPQREIDANPSLAGQQNKEY